MEETQPPPPPSRKKIRLTRAEAYAMGIPGQRKRRWTFGLVGLLIALALGGALWRFQDLWVPYWFPEEAAPAAEKAADAEDSTAGQPIETAAEAQAAAAVAHLDFLSAAVWDHPQFLLGVRLFNQALDRHRQFLRDRKPATLLAQIEEGATQAARLFDSLRVEAPAAVAIGDYAAAGERLAAEARRLARPAPPEAQTAKPVPSSSSAVAHQPGQPWQHPDYLQGARLFNQALEQYKLFLADKTRTELLKPIEESSFQAAKTFESLKGQAPEGVPLNDHITQCYKLISDCRRQHLEGANAEPANPFDRGTAGPSRRPALPAYQPPP